MPAEINTIEKQILDLLAANDSSALEMIWNQYSNDLLAYLIGIMCSRFDAEDALQEVFVIIARKRQQVAKAKRLKPYLFKMAHNTAVNRIKQNTHRRDQLEKKADWLVFTPEDGTRDDRSVVVATALEKLPEKQRVILTLKFFQEKTFLEISDALGISENTAASRYRYGLSKLKKLMEEKTL